MAQNYMIVKVTLEPGFLYWRFAVVWIAYNFFGPKAVPEWVFKTEIVDKCQ